MHIRMKRHPASKYNNIDDSSIGRYQQAKSGSVSDRPSVRKPIHRPMNKLGNIVNGGTMQVETDYVTLVNNMDIKGNDHIILVQHLFVRTVPRQHKKSKQNYDVIYLFRDTSS